ncbi:MAG: saccharopine dehydrogenase NADP-binding domain-containing protein [Bacteroidota bacterium]|nr:saccharopine dehydrogenase NADP-binding domain-containing protein [Bacteroidota bacterium]
MYIKHKIIIAGAGGIGRAAGIMLADQPDFDVDLFIGDLHGSTAESVCHWITSGTSSLIHAEPFVISPSEVSDQMDYIFKTADILLDCLPGSESPRMAGLAVKYGMHYVNLTEYVKETDEIIELSKNSEYGFVLQSGLAPGYINILAHQLYKKFTREFGTKVDTISMKVGALTRMACQPHYYGFTWSPIGVATEYVKDAIVIRDGQKISVPSLSETSGLVLDGIAYEDDFTSGGAADLPDFFQGKVKQLDYKTLRYPGHYSWIKAQLASIPAGPQQELELLNRMVAEIPHVEDDIIILYSSVSGRDEQGHLHIKEKSLKIEPMIYAGYKLKAIQVSTAAPMLEAARMLLTGKWKGPILQSQIDPDEFLNGPFIQQVYNRKKKEVSKVDII